ncbi:hypothetical protein CKAH01_14741 [Colletotrichum kahawae]|uniref:Acyl-CoA oxidase n=1 Tax=Colletotrichum kahawae TaxID=34407 RepID=A0AAD9YLA1_COLKA|nr:hypothetical protein CKAH01_14741 [Colletotrichum kahawae]
MDHILQQDIWHIRHDAQPQYSRDEIKLHYRRAESLVRTSGLTARDILHLTPRFWEFHFDLISCRDMTSFIIATIHLNLCVGTITRYAEHRPDLQQLLDDLACFNTCGEFMLTEVGHGLDARNLETVATQLTDGTYDLHSPTSAAAKAMPPTTPLPEVRRMAVVFARLVVRGEDRGVKPFIVDLNDRNGMRNGVTSLALPTRPGTKPLDHSITSFDHVRLPATALLETTSKPANLRHDFLAQISRVSVGTLSLSIMGVSALRVGAYVAATYSQRRTVTAISGEMIPIISFSTQRRPLLKALAYGEILHAFARWAVEEFTNGRHGNEVRTAIATAFKVLVVRSYSLLNELMERCGWQGLYTYNQISELAATFQGNVVAEGDAMVVSIRLACELLEGKYRLPATADSKSALAKLEAGLFQEASDRVALLSCHHRSEAFNSKILPQYRTLVEAAGQRMAYDAAKISGTVSPEVLDMFEKTCIAENQGWFIENNYRRRSDILEDEDQAFHNLWPLLPELLRQTEAEPYVTAPILDENRWETFVGRLPRFSTSVSGESVSLVSKTSRL